MATSIIPDSQIMITPTILRTPWQLVVSSYVLMEIGKVFAGMSSQEK